jgi:hypothetical protein
LSNNLIRSVDDILDGLKSLPNLTHLAITLPNEEEQTVLVENIGTLKFLNGHKVMPPKAITHPATMSPPRGKAAAAVTLGLKQADLEEIGALYDEIRALHKAGGSESDRHLSEQFDTKV